MVTLGIKTCHPGAPFYAPGSLYVLRPRGIFLCPNKLWVYFKEATAGNYGRTSGINLVVTFIRQLPKITTDAKRSPFVHYWFVQLALIKDVLFRQSGTTAAKRPLSLIGLLASINGSLLLGNWKQLRPPSGHFLNLLLVHLALIKQEWVFFG